MGHQGIKTESQAVNFQLYTPALGFPVNWEKNNQEQAFHLLKEVSEVCAWTHAVRTSFEKLSRSPKQKPIPLSSGTQTSLNWKSWG